VNQQISQPSGAVPWEASPFTARRRSHLALRVSGVPPDVGRAKYDCRHYLRDYEEREQQCQLLSVLLRM
jgi:hypothetical protein